MGPSPDRLGSTIRPGASGLRSTASLLCISILSMLAAPAVAQQDPVNNFCRRFGHQTAVVDNKLYIDGGIINWNMIESPSNYSNPYLLYQDLSVSAPNVGMPPLYANLSKNGTIPYTNGGALWSDSVNKRLYLFGGEHNSEPPSPFNLWSYDIINNQWDSFGTPRSGVGIAKVSYGAGVSVDSRGEAYYYGGWLSNASVQNWGTTPPIATNGLVKYTMDSNSWSNNTGPDSVRRAEGSLHYIPAGSGGMLVYFGGLQDPGNNGTMQGQPMDTIFLYDVLSSRWYTQTATGQIPEMRRRFCAGATWAEDQSSYNIYMYGGATVPGVLGAGYDDVYVLSLPTFTWVKQYPATNGTGSNPHHSLSCNIVPGRAQMIIIGGTFPASDECDYPVQWGTHNVDLGRQNKNKSIWELYSTNKSSYSVPDDIIAVVGGNGNGGASKTAPANGWNTNDLGLMMAQTADISVRTPTRMVSPSPTPGRVGTFVTGAIVGIAIGAAAVIVLFALACFCLVRRRRRINRYHTPRAPRPGHPYHAQSMSEAWSPPPMTHMSPVASPYSPPYGHSPFAPPPPAMSPPPQSAQTVPPHMGPPVELPSESPGGPPTVSTVTPAPAAASRHVSSGATTMAPPSMAPSSMTQTSGVTYPPQQAYFPDPATLSNQVQIDANGNMWVPQVSMMQVATGGGSQHGTPPVYTPPMGDRKSPLPGAPGHQHPTPPVVEVQPTPPPPPPPPAELPCSPQELSAEEVDDRGPGGQRGSKHQTFYNK